MKPRRTLLLVSAALGLLLTSCVDSKNPLSDPDKSKADARLVGVWRARGEDGDATYYHVGRVGEKLPQGVLGVTGVTHRKDGRLQRSDGEFLVFPTVIGDASYLNLSEGSEEQIKTLEEKGWKPDTVTDYIILKYRVDGDTLLIWTMDVDAKERAIKAGQIKGIVRTEKDSFTKTVEFTDTTENVRRFVASAGDGLFNKEPLRLERVK
jgi:hypothetical protein